MGRRLRIGRVPSRRQLVWTVSVIGVGTVAGMGFMAAHVSSDGTDLRPAGGDVSQVLTDRAQAVKVRQKQAAQLQREIDKLSAKRTSAKLTKLRAEVDSLAPAAGFTKVTGPGLRVSLNDAPTSVKAPGIDQNLLVVHQQDIQGFVNALWAGGAQAITLQGQRLITANGIRCVGNTVVLDGVPYSPPYVIEAVGDQMNLQDALDSSSDVTTYKEWASAYQLGLSINQVDHVVAPAYAGSLSFSHITATG